MKFGRGKARQWVGGHSERQQGLHLIAQLLSRTPSPLPAARSNLSSDLHETRHPVVESFEAAVSFARTTALTVPCYRGTQLRQRPRQLPDRGGD